MFTIKDNEIVQLLKEAGLETLKVDVNKNLLTKQTALENAFNTKENKVTIKKLYDEYIIAYNKAKQELGDTIKRIPSLQQILNYIEA